MKIDVYRIISNIIDEELDKSDLMIFSCDDDEQAEGPKVNRLCSCLTQAIQAYVDVLAVDSNGYIAAENGLRVNVRLLLEETMHNGVSYGVTRMFKHNDNPDIATRRETMRQCIGNAIAECPLFSPGGEF